MSDSKMYDERLYDMVNEHTDDNTAMAIMGLLNINVMGVPYRYRHTFQTSKGEEEYIETIYSIDYQRPDGKWAYCTIETPCDSEQAPHYIINEIKFIRETQKELLAELRSK